MATESDKLLNDLSRPESVDTETPKQTESKVNEIKKQSEIALELTEIKQEEQPSTTTNEEKNHQDTEETKHTIMNEEMDDEKTESTLETIEESMLRLLTQTNVCNKHHFGWTSKRGAKWVYCVLFKLNDVNGRKFTNIKINNKETDFHSCPNERGLLHRSLHFNQDEVDKISIEFSWESVKVATDEVKINFSDIKWVNFSDYKDGLKAGKCFETDIYGIYVERVKIFVNKDMKCINEEIVDSFLNKYGREAWNIDAANIECHLFDPQWGNGDIQIYYDDFRKLIYGVPNKMVRLSRVYCGNLLEDQWLSPNAFETRQLYQYLHHRHLSVTSPYYYQNITEPLWIAWRYKWIKNKCLYGQDTEFNIYRSLCFITHHQQLYGFEVEHLKRIPIGILSLILQLLLTIGIVYEVVDLWDIETMFDNDIIIISISVLVFSFISFTYLFTVWKFYQFYHNMQYVCKVSWVIIFLDFMSNVFTGFFLCLVSLGYLLQSETITDVVLNSFALTFILELDDLANMYEADEDVLYDADWWHLTHTSIRADYYPHLRRITDTGRAICKGDYNPLIRRRDIKIPWRTIGVCVLLVFLSPFFIIVVVVEICRKTKDLVSEYRNFSRFQIEYK